MITNLSSTFLPQGMKPEVLGLMTKLIFELGRGHRAISAELGEANSGNADICFFIEMLRYFCNIYYIVIFICCFADFSLGIRNLTAGLDPCFAKYWNSTTPPLVVCTSRRQRASGTGSLRERVLKGMGSLVRRPTASPQAIGT